MVNPHDRVFLVGGGPSLLNFDWSRLANENVIAVNSSIFFVPTANYFVTKDYLWAVRADVFYNGQKRSRWHLFSGTTSTKVFILSTVGGYIQFRDNKVVDVRSNLEYDLSIYDMIIRSARLPGFSKRFSDFRCGSDSGYSALQLAILLGYKKIYLLGYDMGVSSDTHYHKIYGGRSAKTFDTKLKRYAKIYLRSLPELLSDGSYKIFHTCKTSILNQVLPYISIPDLAKEL